MRTCGEELSDDALDRGVEIVRDLVHEADPERGQRVEALAGDEVAAGRALADLRERERRDHRGDDAELHLGEGEDRVGRRHGDVRAGDEPAAAAECVALHPRDHRHRARVDRVQHHPQPSRIGDVLLVTELDGGAHPVDVGARREALALAREDHRARVADGGEGLGQLADQVRVERVAAVGAVHGHAQGVARLLHA